MSIKVSVHGAGKLGACVAAVFAANKMTTTVVDVEQSTVDKLNAGEAPVHEPGLAELLELGHPWLRATTDTAAAVEDSDIAFVIVPTPSNAGGRFSNHHVIEVVESIGRALKDSPKPWYTVAIVSTVMPGSIRGPIREALEEASGRNNGITVSLCYNPTLIALGTVIQNFTHPDLVLIGADDEIGPHDIRRALAPVVHVDAAWHEMSSIDAEIAKLSLNAFLVTKISFANQIGELCEAIPGADGRAVTRAIACDSRIGAKLLQPGPPAGGPCVPTGTLVRTEHGPRPINELRQGDRVFSHDGELHAITEVMTRPYVGDLVELTIGGCGGQPVLLTPEHPVWGTLRYDDDRSYWYETSMRGKRQRRLKMPRRASFPVEFMAAKEYQVGDYVSLPTPVVAPFTPEIIEFQRSNGPDRRIDMSPDFFRFIGYFLAEGSTWHKEIKLSFHAKETDLTDDVIRLADSVFSRKGKLRHTHGLSVHVRFADSALADWLRCNLGSGASNKRPPMKWLGLPEEHLIELLRGMWYGDGSNSGGSFTWATVSRPMWDFMKAALTRFEVAPTSRVARARIGIDGTGHRESYYLRVRNPESCTLMNELLPRLAVAERPEARRRTVWMQDARVVSTIRGRREVPYDGTVWNLEVEGSHSYALEAAIVHNCLPRDSVALAMCAEEFDVEAKLAKAVHDVNSSQALRIAAKLANEQCVGILGLAYKADTPVTDESLGTKIDKILTEWEVPTVTFDPLVGGSMSSAEAVLEAATAVVVTTALPRWAGLDYGIMRVIDVWGILPPEENIERIGVSCS